MRQIAPITPVILSGGAGTRLWPLSSDAAPKQFLPLTEPGRTLFQSTVQRVAGRAGFRPPIIIAHADHRFVVAEQLRALGIEASRIVIEPCPKNTAPAAAVGAILAAEANPDGLILIMPADHVIGDTDAFLMAIDAGTNAAEEGHLVLFGIRPDRPATGYGYIRMGELLRTGEPVRRVQRFVEKPRRQVAEGYLAAGDFVWNSGIFLVPSAGLLAETERHAPDVLTAMREAVRAAAGDDDFLRLDRDAFASSPSISIDYAIFEKTDRAAVIPVYMKWTDIGSWQALWDFVPKDSAGNVALGRVMTEKTTDSYIRSDGPLVAAVGLHDVIVVATEGAVLVVSKTHDQDVKTIVERIEAGKRE